MDDNARLIDYLFYFINILYYFIVDNDNILIHYPYPSDPMIAQRFYEDYSSNNKNEPGETDTGKPKTQDKVNHRLFFF